MFNSVNLTNLSQVLNKILCIFSTRGVCKNETQLNVLTHAALLMGIPKS